MTSEKELFDDVDAKLEAVRLWFDTLSEQEMTFNQKGFEDAKLAAFNLSNTIRVAWEKYSNLPAPTLDDYFALRDTIDADIHQYAPIIMANHDITHDAYRGLQVAFKGLLNGLQKLLDWIADGLEIEQEERADVTSWFEPEETTRSLYDKAIQHLQNFFHPKSRGDHDVSKGKEAEHDQDLTH